MKRVLKEDGCLLIVDFQRVETGFGSPVKIRVSKEEAIELFRKRRVLAFKSQGYAFSLLAGFC